MKLQAILVLTLLLATMAQSQLIVSFSDLGFNISVFGGKTVVREAFIKYSFKGELRIRLTIYMNFTLNPVLSVFTFNINDTQLNVTTLREKVTIESKLSGEGSTLWIKMKISLDSGELKILGNSTLEISSLEKIDVINEPLFFLYISLYLAGILVLVFRRLTIKKREEIIIE